MNIFTGELIKINRAFIIINKIRGLNEIKKIKKKIKYTIKHIFD
jgi:UDP-glucose 6-dehydrogenase